MRYLALATDYDGTLASSGKVEPETVAALERLRTRGLRLLLVTGRRLEDLAHVLEPLELFDRVVAENGAVLHEPATGRTRLLAEPPPGRFLEALLARAGSSRSASGTWSSRPGSRTSASCSSASATSGSSCTSSRTRVR